MWLEVGARGAGPGSEGLASHHGDVDLYSACTGKLLESFEQKNVVVWFRVENLRCPRAEPGVAEDGGAAGRPPCRG